MILPKVVKIRQRFEGPVVKDIDEAVAAQLAQIEPLSRMAPGMKIGITAGSRGIANIAAIIRAVVCELKRRGAEAFIIPAMGSHGGATAEGQIDVLASLGITESFCQAPILSSMEVAQIGETADGTAVFCDKHALSMDGIILVNRIKMHTDFKSPIGIESGLMKMAAIGLGKHVQALNLHSFGVGGIRDLMPKVAEVILHKTNILCGIGIVENAFEQTAVIEAVPTVQIPEREKALLQLSASLMPKLPADDIDLLIVDQIGKNYSGTGMDTNMIGRLRILGVEEPVRPRIKYIVASDLSEESHGNALGIGLADVTTQRLFDKIDKRAMNENVVTSTFLHRAMIPLVMDNDRQAIHAAIRGIWGVTPENLRVMRIPNTLHLEYVYVSEAIMRDKDFLSRIEVVSEPEDFRFDPEGYLLP